MTSEPRRAVPMIHQMQRGRILTRMAGVNDSVLWLTPAESARHTALGGVVLGTATLSALEMYLLLHTVNDGFPIAALVIVPAWFGFILNFDRLLMTKLSGQQWTSKLKVALPRVVLALLFALVLAEPLLLTVFHTAIEERIRTERSELLRTATASYERCNALDAAGRRVGNSAPACGGYLVSVAVDPAATTAQVARTQQSIKDLQKKLDTDQAEYSKLTQKTWRECNGIKGGDVTGVAGVGPECLNMRDQAATFYQSHRIADTGTQLKDLQDRLPGQVEAASQAAAAYAAAVREQTDQAVGRLEAAQQEIGLLERMAAFDRLRADNGYLTSASWLLRAFFTAIECAPLLVKMFGGRTIYDEVLDSTLESQKRVAQVRIERAELDTTYGDQLAIEERKQDLKDEQQRLRRRDRTRHLQSELDMDQAIAEHAERLRAQKIG